MTKILSRFKNIKKNTKIELQLGLEMSDSVAV